jgi:hypothetical protein
MTRYSAALRCFMASAGPSINTNVLPFSNSEELH